MTAMTFDDPRFSRLIQRLVDERVARMLTKQVPERHYGKVVLVDEDNREATVRQQQGALTVDTPHVHWGSFTPEVGQRVGYTQWRKTGDVYIDAAVDPVTPAEAADAVEPFALDRIRLKSVVVPTITTNTSGLVTVTWDTPFADDQYLIFATLEEANTATDSGDGLQCQATSHTALAVEMRVANTTTSDRTPTLMAMGVHL